MVEFNNLGEEDNSSSFVPLPDELPRLTKRPPNRWAVALAAALAMTCCLDAFNMWLGISGYSDATANVLSSTALVGTGQFEPVFQRIAGLAAHQSLITGVLDPDTLTGSYYWTCVIHNSTSEQQEACLEMVLPEGAAVTRATLWINGVPQEAAFNSTAKVEHAYNWITRQHRDPLLVTQSSPGHISIKAAPVMPGQDMQFRLGITAAARPRSNRLAQYELPYIERANLALDCQQDVHIEAPGELSATNVELRTKHAVSGFLCRGSISVRALRNLSIDANRSNAQNVFRTRATHSQPAAFIVGKIEQTPSGGTNLLLQKTVTAESGMFFPNDDAAHRLSTMWAYAEIERLNAAGDNAMACELANVYRVVSSVSGATVLETENDYNHEYLDRDIYKTVSYVPPGFVNPAARYSAPVLGAGSSLQTPALADALYDPYEPSNSARLRDTVVEAIFAPLRFLTNIGPHGCLQSTLSQSFSTVVSQLNVLNSYSSTSTGEGRSIASVSNLPYSPTISQLSDQPSRNVSETETYVQLAAASLDPASYAENTTRKLRVLSTITMIEGAFSGLGGSIISNSLVGNSQNFDYWTGAGRLPRAVLHSFSSPSLILGSACGYGLLTMLFILNFAGSVWMFINALRKWAYSQPGSSRELGLAAGWFVGALVLPDISQMLFLLRAFASMMQKTTVYSDLR